MTHAFNPRPRNLPPLDEDEADYPMVQRMQRRDAFFRRGNVEAADSLRKLMNNAGAAKFCHLPPCRRAGACVAPKIDCAFQNLPSLQRYVLPAMRDWLIAHGTIEDPARFNGAALRAEE